MHLAKTFQLLQQPQNNFLQHLSQDDYRFVRRTVIQIVLATDMANHAELVKVRVCKGCCSAYMSVSTVHSSVDIACKSAREKLSGWPSSVYGAAQAHTPFPDV